MTASIIKEEVKKLPRTEQLSLLQFIVNLLQEDDYFVLSDAWKAELDKRDEDFLNGTEKLHSWEEAKELILAALAEYDAQPKTGVEWEKLKAEQTNKLNSNSIVG